MNKETGSAEKFWLTQSLDFLNSPIKGNSLGRPYNGPDDDRMSTISNMSNASKTSNISRGGKAKLQKRMDELSSQLEEERSYRRRLESQLDELRMSGSFGSRK